MNNKLLLGIVAIAVLGVFMLMGNKKSNPLPTPSTEQASPAEQQPTTPQASDGAMMKEAENVAITSTGFEPATITIKAGTKVIWTNKSGAVATVNSAMHPTHLVYPPLNLNEVEDGKTVELVFDKAGTYKYHDHLNPSRFGTVVVE